MNGAFSLLEQRVSGWQKANQFCIFFVTTIEFYVFIPVNS